MNQNVIICDECNYEFPMNSVKIEETTVDVGKQVLTLVYFTCPKCRKIYRVLLKDEWYETLKKDLDQTKARIRKNYGRNNEEIARTLNFMVNKKLTRLRNHVTRINKKFSGTFTFVASENNNEEMIVKYLP